MGIMTIFTDSYLNNFPIFKSVKDLLDSYEDNSSESIPSSDEFLSYTLFNNWTQLIDLMYDKNQLSEEFWKNFNVCLSEAYYNKGNDRVLNYLAAAIGIEVREIKRDKSSNKLTIEIGSLYLPPRLDQFKRILSQGLSDLLSMLNPSIDLTIDDVIINVGVDEMPISSGIMAKTVSQYIELEVIDE